MNKMFFVFESKNQVNMNQRPKSVLFISWFLIITGSISLLTSLTSINNPVVLELMAKSPIPIPVQFILMYAGLIVSIISGFFMLRGANWARLLFVIWSAIGLLIGVATSPAKIMLVPGAIIYVIEIFFLFRPCANKFFAS